MTSRRRTLAWGAIGFLLLTPLASREPGPGSTVPYGVRLLGPFAGLAADVQWVRFQRARLGGRQALALRHAERALALDPTRTAGWDLLASHLGLFLASPERTPDPELRLEWFRAGLEVTRRGQAHAAEPGALMFLRGLLMLTKAEQDPGVWPAGARDLWSRGAAAFEEAARAGVEGAAELARYARERSGA